MTADAKLLRALAALRDALAESGVPAMIIGGIAVIAHGVARQTIDIDATVWGASIRAEDLLPHLERHGIRPRIDDALTFARQQQVLLLRHDATGVPMEIAFSWLPFEKEAIDRADEIDFNGVVVRMARPEDLIIYKVAAWRGRDRDDIRRLLAIHRTAIDLTRVRALVAEICTALDDPERLEEFEAMLSA